MEEMDKSKPILQREVSTTNVNRSYYEIPEKPILEREKYINNLEQDIILQENFSEKLLFLQANNITSKEEQQNDVKVINNPEISTFAGLKTDGSVVTWDDSDAVVNNTKKKNLSEQ